MASWVLVIVGDAKAGIEVVGALTLDADSVLLPGSEEDPCIRHMEGVPSRIENVGSGPDWIAGLSRRTKRNPHPGWRGLAKVIQETDVESDLGESTTNPSRDSLFPSVGRRAAVYQAA